MAIALAFAGMLALPMSSLGASHNDAGGRLLGLETHAGILGAQVAGLSDALSAIMPVPPAVIGGQTLIVAQNSRDAASINVRIGQMEEQIRVLTGQVEGLQFQMTQLQVLLERMQEDNDARFSDLEGGGRGKTSAVTQSGGVTLPGELSQNQSAELPQNLIGQGLVGTGAVVGANPEALTLGTPGQILGELPARALTGNGLGQPTDFGTQTAELVSDADADAQYRAGYDAAVRGDLDFAEGQFRQFIALFPDHAQAPDATNWLGDALLQRGEYDDAADILLTGFQAYPNSARAPDMLMKLGQALAGAGEVETACRTFGEVLRRYPGLTAAFQGRLRDEAAKAQCG